MADFNKENERENRINMAMVRFYTSIMEAQSCLIEVGDLVIKTPGPSDEAMLAKVMDAIESLGELEPTFAKITKHTVLRRELLNQRMRDEGVLSDEKYDA